MVKKPRHKKCRVCPSKFEVNPSKPFIVWCSVECAYKHQANLKAKRETKNRIELKKSLLTHKDYLKMLQVTFNTYIRVRDEKKGCISCGTSLLNRKHDAGHYFSVGGYPNVRFDEMNVHGQCVPCNQHNHGRIHEYSVRLPERIGAQEFELLKDRARSVVSKLSIPEIKELIISYKLKIKKLKYENQNFHKKQMDRFGSF